MNLRPLITIALIIGFSAIAVFGAFAMGQSAGEQNACIAATVNGLSCIVPSNLASIASGYLSAFGTFSSAWFSVLVLLTLFVTGFFVVSDERSLGSSSSVSFFRRIADIIRFSARRPVLTWISIHENSPSHR